MAKNSVNDWDVVASNNADVGGIGILGTNAVSNFDGGLRTVMAQIASALLVSGAYAQTLTAPQKLQAQANLGLTADPWENRAGVGSVYMVDTSKTGAEIPPSSIGSTVWIELTAGLTGSGQFNNGKLTSESVSGSAPLVLATATINLASSPMNGQSINLLNTEGRILRPSTSPSTLQDSAMESHVHSVDPPSTATASGGAHTHDVQVRLSTGGSTAGIASAPNGSTASTITNAALSDGAHTHTVDIAAFNSAAAGSGNETRMKNIGVKAYMRIK